MLNILQMKDHSFLKREIMISFFILKKNSFAQACFLIESASQMSKVACGSLVFIVVKFLTNLIKIRSFDLLPRIATKGSNETLYKG